MHWRRERSSSLIPRLTTISEDLVLAGLAWGEAIFSLSAGRHCSCCNFRLGNSLFSTGFTLLCSFDVVQDQLGLVRSEFPHTLYGVAGTQVASRLHPCKICTERATSCFVLQQNWDCSSFLFCHVEMSFMVSNLFVRAYLIILFNCWIAGAYSCILLEHVLGYLPVCISFLFCYFRWNVIQLLMFSADACSHL